MFVRENLSTRREVKDMLIADLVLAFAFDLVFNGGVFGLSAPGVLLRFFPIAFVAVTFSFVLHEYMHKVVAEHYGSIAAFRKSDTGLLITLATSLFGFLIGLPGATVIYTNYFTKKEDAYVSLAGPLTNFAVFAVFFLLSLTPLSNNSYIYLMLSFTMLTSLILAFFNMLPIYPLDGSKVYRWNKGVYFGVVAAIFIILIVTAPLYFGIPVYLIVVDLFIMLVLGFIIGMASRAVLF